MRHHEEGGEAEREEAQEEEEEETVAQEEEEEEEEEGSEARGAKEGGHNCSGLRPIHSSKIDRPFEEEDDDDVQEGCCDTDPDFFFGDSSSFAFQNESKGFVPSCSDSPSEQLSKILASLRGQMVEERARKQLDFDQGSLIMDDSSQNREFNPQSNPQTCRVSHILHFMPTTYGFCVHASRLSSPHENMCVIFARRAYQSFRMHICMHCFFASPFCEQ
jgi:hypothetical protein